MNDHYYTVNPTSDHDERTIYANVIGVSSKFTTDAGSLENLNGKSFQVKEVDFVKEYFPNAKI